MSPPLPFISTPYYGPDASAYNIFLERTFLAGDVISGTGYGIQVILFVSCATILYSQYSRSLRSSSSFLIKGDTRALFLLLYITLLFVVESIYTAVQARTVQLMYIDNRNYPGGPWAYFLATQKLPVNILPVLFHPAQRVPHLSMRTNGDTVIRMCLIKGTTWIKVTAIRGNA